MSTKFIPLGLIAWIAYSAIKYPNIFAIFAAKGITRGAIYALIALGFGLIYNSTGILNLAHGEVFMLGAVTSTVVLLDVFKAGSASFGNALAFLLVFSLCIPFGAALSAATDVLVFRKLRKSNKLSALIASLGIGLIFQNIGIKVNGSGKKEFDSIFPEMPPYPSLTPAIQHMVLVLLLTIPTLAVLAWISHKSHNGLAVRAVGHDHDVARLMGVDVDRTLTRIFAISGVAAAIAGLVFAQEYRVTNYSLGLEIGLIAYAAAIIGGVSRVKGTILGGFAIGLIESLSNGLPSGLGYRWSESAIFSVFILVLVYRPHGIFGIPKSDK